MKRISLVLFADLFIFGCLKPEELSATQQPPNQRTTQTQSASQSASTTQNSPEHEAPIPATPAKPQELAAIPDKPKTVVIPAGSVITVRLVNPLDSSSKTGDAFTAIVTGVIAVGGEVAVPSGVVARGQVTGVKAKNKSAEKVRLKLVLTSFTVDGASYPIETKLFESKAIGKGKSTTTSASGVAETPDESGLVFILTVPVTVNR